jgi:hypothetical protein
MKKDFIVRSVIIPAITALLVGAVVTALAFTGAERFSYLRNGSEIAYFDDLSDERSSASLTDENFDLKNLKPNTVLGTIESDDTLTLSYQADYSRLESDASLEKGSSSPLELGCAYVKIGANNRRAVSKSKPLILSGDFGEVRYEYDSEFTVSDESLIPLADTAGERCLMVWYHLPGKAGIKRACRVLVFKGVL